MPLLDNELYEWFVQQRSKGVSITGPMLQEKARSFNRSYNRLIFLLLYVLQGQNEENIFKLKLKHLLLYCPKQLHHNITTCASIFVFEIRFKNYISFFP